LSGRRPLILLHGWTMCGAIFDDLAARLGDVAQCHAPDLPGHGAAADRPATLDACAALVAEQVAAARAPPVLLGWSMGAAAAWRYIAREGCGALAGLVTVDMSPRLRPAADWCHGLKRQSAEDIMRATARIRQDWPAATGSIAANMFATPAGAPGLAPQQARRLILSQDAAAMQALWEDLLTLDERATIAGIDRPYLVCSGAQSRVYPASAATWLAQAAPQARHQVFARSGHSPHLEEPAAMSDALRRFIRALPA